MDTSSRHLKRWNSAFSLIELMVVVTIIAFLAGILYPSLQAAREEARSTACLASVRSCVQGVNLWASFNGREYPAAYESPDDPPGRYVTWAGLLSHEGYFLEATCRCPSLSDGGLPAANPRPGEECSGQVSETPGVVDDAPRRCAYTVNEVICPQPRFTAGENHPHPARRVSTDEVETDVILITEFAADWRVLSPGDTTCRSYLPVHGLVGMGSAAGRDKYDLNAVIAQSNKPCFKDGCYRRCRAEILIPEPERNLTNPPRMNLIGRNHSRCDSDGFRKTSFAYIDGHAVSMTAPETLSSTEWGHKVYSVMGDQRITKY